MYCSNKILYLITLAGILGGILAGVFFSLAYDLPQINQLKEYKPSAITSVYSADRHLIGQFYTEKRIPVRLSHVPQSLIDALLIIEDRSFYTHSGVDFKGILRAVIHDLKARRFKQGASTITQQLAKTLFLSSEKSITRKIKEAILALQIERRYTKNEILELYLNQIYLGAGAYGVEAACQIYFGTSVAEISLSQAAMIAGLPKAPSYYSPQKSLEHATSRRNLVLKQMLATKTITQNDYQQAIKKIIEPPTPSQTDSAAGHFTEYVKQWLGQTFDRQKIGSGGLKIYTTLNLNDQRSVQQIMLKHMDHLKQRRIEKKLDVSKTECAVIAIDTMTGQILCMTGGLDFTRSRFNRSVQAMRQPGSAFKPLVYAAALNQGYSQSDLIFDTPLSYPVQGGTQWTVHNFSNTYSGKMTLRTALALSKNTTAVRLLEKIGPEKVIEFARKSGITTPMAPTLSLALGSYEVTLLELTAAYIPFANMGVFVAPYAIEKITNADSRIMYENTIHKRAIMDRNTAAVITDMLKAAIFEGTGKKAAFIKKDIAGKTGTTNQFKDALFIGYSPDIALGVWVGNDDSSSLGEYETGAKAALPIWSECMATFLINRPVQYFDIPEKTKMVYMNPETGEISDIKIPGTVKVLVKENKR